TTLVWANVEDLVLTGTDSIDGTGNTLNNIITGNSAANSLSGANGDDTLNGADGNDSLDGGMGNDALDGGVGNDTMLGGANNDTYIVDSSTDVVTELANAGTDRVLSYVTYTLSNNVENLELLGAAAIDGSGNSSPNQIYG